MVRRMYLVLNCDIFQTEMQLFTSGKVLFVIVRVQVVRYVAGKQQSGDIVLLLSCFLKIPGSILRIIHAHIHTSDAYW